MLGGAFIGGFIGLSPSLPGGAPKSTLERVNDFNRGALPGESTTNHFNPSEWIYDSRTGGWTSGVPSSSGPEIGGALR